MSAVVFVAVLIATNILYNTTLIEQQKRLREIVDSRAKTISELSKQHEHHLHQMVMEGYTGEYASIHETIRSLYSEEGTISDHGSMTASTSTNALLNGGDLDFVVVTRSGEQVVFIVGGKYGFRPVDYEAVREKPIGEALDGESGTGIVTDHVGMEYLVAFRPVADLSMALVAKLPLEVFRSTYIRAGVNALMIALILIVVGGLFLRRMVVPLVQIMASRQHVLEEATRAKDDFFASMSHELRTPLTSIIGNSELLLESEDSSKKRETLMSVHAAGQAQLALVNDILDMSKIDSGMFSIDDYPYELSKILKNVENMVSVRVSDAGLTLQIIQKSAEPFLLSGDANRISQITGVPTFNRINSIGY